MTTQSIFNFSCSDADGANAQSHRIRVISLDGAPWFVAADVCRALGFRHVESSMSRYVSRLAGDRRRKLGKSDGLACTFPMWAASEAGLYDLIMRSESRGARPFQDWVTGEVLPAIRRTGGYRLQGVAPEAVEEGTVSEMPEVAGVMAQMRELRAEMAAQTERLEARIAEEVAKVLAAVQKTPNPAELVPNLRAGKVAGLPFVPEGVTPYDVACAKV